MTATATKKPLMKFRIVHGIHVEPGPKRSNAFHPQNSVIESDLDLCKLFNPPVGTGMAPKYERVPDHVAVTSRVPVEGEEPVEVVKETAANETGSSISGLGNAAPTDDPNPNDLPVGLLKNIDSMTLKELQAYAAEEEIDLGNATKVQDVRHILKQKLPR